MTYLDDFGFTEQPFSNTPDPKFLFRSKTHSEALKNLLDGIARRKGFFVLTGDVGTGKSTLCRALMTQLDDRVDTALVLNPDLSEVEILSTIIRDFGLDANQSKSQMMDALYLHLVRRARQGKTSLIIIDDAQNLPLRSLEQVRMISNFETDKEKLVQILLVGQPELNEKLQSWDFRQIRQRISEHPHLEPLNAVETRAYIEHRLVCSGGAPDKLSFTERAFRRIQGETRGYPRAINTLCDRALVAASARALNVIDAEIIREESRKLDVRPSLFFRLAPRSRWAAGIVAACAVAVTAPVFFHVARVPAASPLPREASPGVAAKLNAMEDRLAALQRRFKDLPDSSAVVASLTSQGEALERNLTTARTDADRLRSLLRQKEGELQALQASRAEPAETLEKNLASARNDADRLRSLVQQKERDQDRENELEATVHRLQSETQNRAEQIRHLEKAIDTLKARIGETQQQRETLSRSLQEKERLLASRGADKGDVADLEALRSENAELRKNQKLIQNIAGLAIKARDREIEQLNREKEELLRLPERESFANKEPSR